MFYHVVMMRLTDAADTEFHARMQAYVERVRRELTGVQRFVFARNVADRGKGFDWAAVGTFDSSAAHDAYQVSPLHQEMRAFILPFVADLVVCDCEG